MDNKYCDILRTLRKMHGYLQPDIAGKLDELNAPTTKAQVSRWENGINNPSIDQFIGLCRIYGVKDVYSVFGMGDMSDMEYSLNREKRNDAENSHIFLYRYEVVLCIRRMCRTMPEPV